jgi:putative DNA primase/helicase
LDALMHLVGARLVGNRLMGHCRAHDDRTPSLAIDITDDGKILLHCFAGCSQAAIEASLRPYGLWPPCGVHDRRTLEKLRPARAGSRNHPQADRSAAVCRIAREATQAQRTLVPTYLRRRGITLPVPDALRYLPSLRHRSGFSGPAMIALVTRGEDPRPVAIHRTWLAPDGSGKAPVEPAKMMLGPCRGGAVRLAPFGQPLLVGEGIETTLAAMQATGHCGWAALSASGVRTLELPEEARDIIILADGDDAGTAAANAAASRWHREDRRVRIAQAPTGTDFNDLLIADHGRTWEVGNE